MKRLVLAATGIGIALVIAVVAVVGLSHAHSPLNAGTCFPEGFLHAQWPKWIWCALGAEQNLAAGLIAAAGALFAAFVIAYAVWQQIAVTLYSREENRIEARLPGLRATQQAALNCIRLLEPLVPQLEPEVTAHDQPSTSSIVPQAISIFASARMQIEGELPNVSEQRRQNLIATFGHLIKAAEGAVVARGEAGTARHILDVAAGLRASEITKHEEVFNSKNGRFRSQEMIFKQALVAARTYLQDTSRYIASLEARLRAYSHNLEELLLTKRD
jgi:hypothetical protein